MDDDTPGPVYLPWPFRTAQDYLDGGWRDVADDVDGQLHVVLGPGSGLTAVQCDPSDLATVRDGAWAFVVEEPVADRFYLLYARPPGVSITRTYVSVRRLVKVCLLGDGHPVPLPRMLCPEECRDVRWRFLREDEVRRDFVRFSRHGPVTPLPLRYAEVVEAEKPAAVTNVVKAVEGFIGRNYGVSQAEVDSADHLGGTRSERRRAVGILLNEGRVERRDARRGEGSAARSKSLLFPAAGGKSQHRHTAAR